MWQTLFHIPHERLGIPVFGVGWVLAAFVVASSLYLAVQIRRHGVDREVLGYLPVLLIVCLAIVFLLPQLEQVEDGVPRGIPIRGYGVMVLLAIVASVWLAAWRARQMGVDPEIIFSLAFYVFVLGILGARLFYAIQYWERIRGATWRDTLTALLSITEGGLVVYGSFVGGVVAFAWFVFRRKLPALALSDLVAPSLALGLAIGRIGCLMNGCCFGGLCGPSWVLPMSFPSQSPPYEYQLRTGQFFGFRLGENRLGEPVIDKIWPNTVAAGEDLKQGDVIREIGGHSVSGLKDQAGNLVPALAAAQDYLGHSEDHVSLTLENGRVVNLRLTVRPVRSLAIHPTQIYSSINGFLLCGLLLAYYPFRRRDGEVTALLLTLYPITRFLLEIIRSDEGLQPGTGMTISQTVSLFMLVFVVGLWFYVLRQPRRTVWPPQAAVADRQHPARDVGTESRRL